MSANNKLIKWIAISTVGIIGIYLAVSLAIYRIPATGEPETFAGKVIYKLNDNTGTNRQFFEERVMGNHLVRLDDESVWYISKDDYTIFWPENPYEMRKTGYTIRIELKAQKLMFGGYLMQEIRERDLLNEEPTIIE